MKRFAALLLAGLLCAGLAGCGGQPGDVSEELAGLSSQLEAINQRLDKLEESAGNQEGLSSHVDSLTKRLEALENAAQQPTPASEAEPTPAPEEPSQAVASIGQVVFEEGGVKVTYTGMYGDIIGGEVFTFSIENSSEQVRGIASTFCLVNGILEADGFEENVFAGETYDVEITLRGRDSRMRDAGIQTLETLEFHLVVSDEEATVLQNEAITIPIQYSLKF